MYFLVCVVIDKNIFEKRNQFTPLQLVLNLLVLVHIAQIEELLILSLFEINYTPWETGKNQGLEMTASLAKKVAFSIVEPLTNVLTVSLKTDVVPRDLKVAKVILLFKPGDSSMLTIHHLFFFQRYSRIKNIWMRTIYCATTKMAFRKKCQ